MYIIGIMSGTSLDGIDMAYCEFTDSRHFHLIAAETYRYPAAWQERLASLHRASAEEYALADVELGRLIGEKVKQFIENHPGRVDCIASHGHTVFHQPERGLTAQIGDANAIHAATGLPVVYDFRRLDVALGGQGAPLVPIGDKLLFSQYDCCINLGGIANISYELNDQRIALSGSLHIDYSFLNLSLNFILFFAQYGIVDAHDIEQASCHFALLDMLGFIMDTRFASPTYDQKYWDIINIRVCQRG